MSQELECCLQELQDEFKSIRIKVTRCAQTAEKSRPARLADDLLSLSDWADAFAHKLDEISKAARMRDPL